MISYPQWLEIDIYGYSRVYTFARVTHYSLLVTDASKRFMTLVVGASPASAAASESARAISYWLHVSVNPEVRHLTFYGKNDLSLEP
jgi:hypothetical protein